MKKILLGLALLLALCEISVSFASAIPDNCKSYFDGCNNCSRQAVGGEMACTMMWCENPGKAVCSEYFTTTSPGITGCTKEYTPVCAQPPMSQCPSGMVCAQVMPAPKTYTNACVAKNAKATILYSKECKTGIVIPPTGICQSDAKICPDGVAVSRTGSNCQFDCSAHQLPNSCTMDAMVCPDGTSVGRTESNCQFDCSAHQLPNSCTMDAKVCPDGTSVGRTGANCQFDCSAHQKTPICTREYVPVCAQDPKRACPSGAQCFISDLRTYSNACIAKADGATIISQGECNENYTPGSSAPNSGGGSDGENQDDDIAIGACTMDAKICPDGTTVGRTGLDCQFDCSSHQKACTKEYAPVCGSDGITYNSSCLAGETPIAYQGSCLDSKTEASIKSKLFSAIEKKISPTNNPGVVATILENVAQKSMLLAQKSGTPQKQGLYNYSAKVIYEYLQTKVYEVYLKENLNTIIPGSNSSENSISWTDIHTAQITSLSGDSASSTEVKVGVKDKTLFYQIGE